MKALLMLTILISTITGSAIASSGTGLSYSCAFEGGIYVNTNSTGKKMRVVIGESEMKRSIKGTTFNKKYDHRGDLLEESVLIKTKKNNLEIIVGNEEIGDSTKGKLLPAFLSLKGEDAINGNCIQNF